MRLPKPCDTLYLTISFQGAWDDSDHCAVTGPLAGYLPIPHDFTTAYQNHPAGELGNNGFGMQCCVMLVAM